MSLHRQGSLQALFILGGVFLSSQLAVEHINLKANHIQLENGYKEGETRMKIFKSGGCPFLVVCVVKSTCQTYRMVEL